MKTDALPSAPSQTKPKTQIAWPHVVLSVLGLAASLYAVHLHNLVKAGADTGCGISEGISCDKVIGSQWGEFFGIPLGVFGAVFWLVVAVMAVSGPQVSPRSAALQRLGVATVGILSSLGLSYIAYIVIRVFCPVCATTHFLTLVNFMVALRNWLKINKARV